MPPKGWRKSPDADVPDTRCASTEFEQAIVLVPTEVFVEMVTRSGLPHLQARELCLMFKEMKGE